MKNNKELLELMDKEYAYPKTDDEDLQEKIYKKREFHLYRFMERDQLNTYEDIKNYRDRVCSGSVSLREQQVFLSNYINPNTPYKGILVFHGTGTGKTCVGIAIAENFKPLVQKYGTKIHILVKGPLLKENWKNHVIKCTGETYLKQSDGTIILTKEEQERNKKNAISVALQYYRFMSYKSFYKKVLGEKIVDKESGEKKKTYKKTDTGEIARDVSIDRIQSLDNTVIIVDEAHNLTGNVYGEALKKIIDQSVNLKIVLITGTPSKNSGDDVIELINLLRPADSPIDKDKIFSGKIHNLKIKFGGIEYLKKMARGYVSHLRGADPLTFAIRNEKGEVPPGLIFTKVTRCNMLEHQLKTYNTTKTDVDNTLDRKSQAVANFIFPGLGKGNKLELLYGIDGLNTVTSQLKNNSETINELVCKQLLNLDETIYDFITLSQSGKFISGKMFNLKYLKLFSIKFYKALKKLSRLVWGKKGVKTAFIYSNLVKLGVEMFQEVLLQNGYLEYNEQEIYSIRTDTICYYCGYTKADHKDEKMKVYKSKITSESSSEYENVKDSVPQHEFAPATFTTVTGTGGDEEADVIPEDRQKILDNVFSNVSNKEGKRIKFVIGSPVMNEGISLNNVGEVHILDVHFNFGRVDQVIGRGIRQCSHYDIMNEDIPYPNVNVYKYVVSLKDKDELSSEEDLYKKAELKYIIVKQIDRALKEVAVDCANNRNGNVFLEEVEMYKGCSTPLEYTGKKGEILCPSKCDYTNCDYKCDSTLLNTLWWDDKKKIYKKINKKDIDYSTFTKSFATGEIDAIKQIVKFMYKLGYVYKIEEIVEFVKSKYDPNKLELFDEFFVFKVVDLMTPVTESDMNNFRDTIYDKFNRPGYLIYVNGYYIFQPFDQHENVPMYYRTKYDKLSNTSLSVYSYLRSLEVSDLDDEIVEQDVGADYTIPRNIKTYDFDSVQEYYNNRNEFDYVGVIDYETKKKKSRNLIVRDVFKIREKRVPSDKKRAAGVPTLKGSVCYNSKDIKYLDGVVKKLGMDIPQMKNRASYCDAIKSIMLFYEKYSVGKDKITYVMIPKNHDIYKFPYNLEDRVEYFVSNIVKNADIKISDITVKSVVEKEAFKIVEEMTNIVSSLYKKGLIVGYQLAINDSVINSNNDVYIKSCGFVKYNNIWTLLLN